MNTKRFSQSYKYGRVRLRKEVSSGIWQAVDGGYGRGLRAVYGPGQSANGAAPAGAAQAEPAGVHGNE